MTTRRHRTTGETTDKDPFLTAEPLPYVYHEDPLKKRTVYIKEEDKWDERRRSEINESTTGREVNSNIGQ